METSRNRPTKGPRQSVEGEQEREREREREREEKREK